VPDRLSDAGFAIGDFSIKIEVVDHAVCRGDEVRHLFGLSQDRMI